MSTKDLEKRNRFSDQIFRLGRGYCESIPASAYATNKIGKTKVWFQRQSQKLELDRELFYMPHLNNHFPSFYLISLIITELA